MGTKATPPPSRPSSVRFGVLGFICVLALITYLDRICIMRAAEDIRKDLSIDKIAMGLIFSAFLLGYALFEVPGGWLGDRWGTRRTLFGIVLCWSLFTALTGCVWPFLFDTGLHLNITGVTVPLVGGLAVMLLVRFLFGTAEAGAFPNMARVIRTWFPYHERARAQGLLWMSARLGGALAPATLGWLSWQLGWRPAFWVLGGLGISWALLFVWWFRDRPSDMPQCNEAERELILQDAALPPTPARRASEEITTQPPSASAAKADHDGHAWLSLRVLVSSVTMWALCTASCFVCFGWYFYPTWQPEFFKEVFGITYKGSEWLTGLPFLVGAVGALLGGNLSDHLVQRTGNRRWGRSLVGLFGFFGAGVCVLFTGFVSHPWQAVVLLCLASFINDLAIPVIWAATTDISGRYAGTVSGIMNTAGGIGGILVPTLIPHVREGLSAQFSPAVCWQIIFAGLGSAWFIAALAWLFIDASKPLTEDEQP
jgi:ACS family glucarate transporter-like MFS transporter